MSAVAVGPVAVVRLQELLVLALQVVLEDDASDPSPARSPERRMIVCELGPRFRRYEERWIVRFAGTVDPVLLRCKTEAGLTGIYAVLSFTASQRTREVGIRVALGGRPRHVIAVLFRRPLMQIGLGILIGLVIADRLSEGDMLRVIAVYGCAVVAISALATLGPVRRALRIQPIDALRAE